MQMKDYYQILQVHPQAEPEIIEAAYRRLMRKYHPDALSPEERNDPENTKRAQEIIEAYEVLNDPVKRQLYDALLQKETVKEKAKAVQPKKSEPEKRYYLVKCSKSNQTFKMLLARQSDFDGPFSVLGFEVWEQTIPQLSNTGNEEASLFDKFKRKWTRKKIELSTDDSPNQPNLPSDEEIVELFDQAKNINFGDIYWGMHKCPSCAGEIDNPNGTLATWTRCGNCSNLLCVGGSEIRGRNVHVNCPWCGSKRKLTHSIPPGSKIHLPLGGKLTTDTHEDLEQNQTRLSPSTNKKISE